MTEHHAARCVLLVGEGSTPEAAGDFVKIMGRCIYLATISASDRLVVAAFVLPEAKRWWLEGLAEDPRLVGLERAQLNPYIYRGISSPWSRGELVPGAGEPPCGAHCPTCPVYGSPCPGCVASAYCRDEIAARVAVR